jgi:hypothetical protein
MRGRIKGHPIKNISDFDEKNDSLRTHHWHGASTGKEDGSAQPGPSI